jgi:radical SAM protein with 4Fe4S-binding SPASM domain
MTKTLQWTKRLNQKKVDEVYLRHFGQRYREYRRLWNIAGEDFVPHFPINLDFEVVDACNLRCRHCFRNKEISDKIGLVINTGVRFPLDLFKKIMKEAADYGLKALNFGFSGECLLNPDLIELINLARNFGILDIRLLTNGTLITRQTADRLLESPLTLLSFSVDAGCAETYEYLKGKGYFNSLRDIMKYTYRRRFELKKDFPLIRASFYPSPENRGEREMFLEKFQDHVDFIDFQIFHDMRKAKSDKIRTDCKEPFQRLAISANGNVSPCCTFFSKKVIVGNANRTSIKEIWDSKTVKKIREKLIKQNPLPACRECLCSSRWC